MKKVLILCSQCPHPPTDGAKLRLYNTAKILNRQYIVDVLVVQNKADEGTLSQLRSEFHSVIPFSHSKTQFYRNMARGIASRKPIRAHYYIFDDVHRWLDAHERKYDLIYANYLNTTGYVRGRDVTKVVDFVDAMSENYLQRAKPSNDENYPKRKLYELEGTQLRRYERTVLRSFDHCFVTTERDARMMTDDLPHSNLTIIPNGVREDLLSASRERDQDRDDAGHPCLVFLGRMDYFPNEDAAEYFTTKVFPQVRERYPDAEFLIVGSHPSERVQALENRSNVTVTGFVESLVEYLSMADVIVAPMRFGTGIQNKILEAMALGKAVVTTPLGTEGIDGQDGTHFLIAEDASEFATSVSSLLDSSSERDELGENARALMEDQYSWKAIGQRFLNLIDHVVDESDASNRD